MRKWKIISGTGLLLLGLLFPAAGCRQVYAEEKTSPEILEGVFIDSVNVSGMNKKEAVQAVEDHMREVKGYRIQLQIGDNVVSVPAGELGLDWDNESVVDKALDFGQKGNIVKQYKARKDLEQEPVRLTLQYGADEASIETVLKEKCVVLDREPENATMTRTEDGFDIVPEKQGITLEVDEAKKTIQDYLSSQWRSGLGMVTLPAKITEAAHKASELQTVQDILGSASTDYSSSSANRAANIQRGTELLNGTVVYPGESVSVTELVIPFDEENGYAPAPSYENGEVVDSYGGGICQVSTTLYMSLLRAELEITERHNHSMIVNYVKPSMDAAISEGYKDLKFTNNLETPIYIEGYTSGGEVGFVVYGQEYRPEGRSVTYESETLETIEPEVELTASQDSFGTITQTGSPHTGYNACLWKIVSENGKETKEQVNSSTYNMTPEKYSVGVRTDSAEAESKLRAAIDANDLNQVYEVINTYG
ncbi:MAG TPA: VanW family protein [Candidatus Ruminococcus avistercoris]|nr:VanW family protein [Candidatus Ruminococcus avistercoris]